MTQTHFNISLGSNNESNIILKLLSIIDSLNIHTPYSATTSASASFKFIAGKFEKSIIPNFDENNSVSSELSSFLFRFSAVNFVDD